jgi:predicted transcriptional regulator
MAWTEDQVLTLIHMRRQGKNVSEIAKHFGRSTQVVYALMKRLQRSGIDLPKVKDITILDYNRIKQRLAEEKPSKGKP